MQKSALTVSIPSARTGSDEVHASDRLLPRIRCGVGQDVPVSGAAFPAIVRQVLRADLAAVLVSHSHYGVVGLVVGPTLASQAMSGKKVRTPKERAERSTRYFDDKATRYLLDTIATEGETVDGKTAETQAAEVSVAAGAKKRGRPRKKLDPRIMHGLGAIGCTRREIATVMGVSESTLTRRGFDALIEKGDAVGKISLRRQQQRLALEGNATMLIWTGKQRLGQSDKIATQVTGAEGGPIEYRSDDDIRTEVERKLDRVLAAANARKVPTQSDED
jgi:hypothetical protein